MTDPLFEKSWFQNSFLFFLMACGATIVGIGHKFRTLAFFLAGFLSMVLLVGFGGLASGKLDTFEHQRNASIAAGILGLLFGLYAGNKRRDALIALGSLFGIVIYIVVLSNWVDQLMQTCQQDAATENCQMMRQIGHLILVSVFGSFGSWLLGGLYADLYKIILPLMGALLVAESVTKLLIRQHWDWLPAKVSEKSGNGLGGAAAATFKDVSLQDVRNPAFKNGIWLPVLRSQTWTMDQTKTSTYQGMTFPAAFWVIWVILVVGLSVTGMWLQYATPDDEEEEQQQQQQQRQSARGRLEQEEEAPLVPQAPKPSTNGQAAPTTAPQAENAENNV